MLLALSWVRLTNSLRFCLHSLSNHVGLSAIGFTLRLVKNQCYSVFRLASRNQISPEATVKFSLSINDYIG